MWTGAGFGMLCPSPRRPVQERPTKGVTTMRGSKNDLPVAIELEDGGVVRQAEWGGMNAELATIKKTLDIIPLFQGLPGNQCQCPHWGYVVKGQIRYRFADREEVFNAGDAYYVGPGHLPIIGDDTEYVEFSPADLFQETMEVVGRNFEAFQSGSR
jgi:hypothetical protein